MIEVKKKIEVKNVKHSFTFAERDELGGDLARALAGLRGVEAEFDQIKASFKAKITEFEARIDRLSTDRMNGFVMRDERCVVMYRPKDREKDYLLERDVLAWVENKSGPAKSGPAPVVLLTEKMTEADFQAELIEAESIFDHQSKIDVFPPAGADQGVLIVGQLKGAWYSALRITVGKFKLQERLDSEQKSFKDRAGAITVAIARAKEWFKENLKEAAKGFDGNLDKVIEANKEKAE